MVFKTWLADLTKVQSVVNNIKNISIWSDGATGLLNPNTVNSLSSSINGLNLQQAQLALSTKNLTQAQMNQVLVQAGLIASEERIQAELLQSALIQAGLSAEKQRAILVDLGLMNARTLELYATKSCTKEELLNVLATKGVTGANVEAIISTLGLSSANEKATLSFGLFTTATWAQVKAQLALMASNPITWLIAVPAIIYGCVKAYNAFTVSVEETRETAEEAKSAVDEIKSDFDTLQSTTDDVKDRFAELAQGVENLGKANQSRGELTTEDYEEFLGLSNQLAELFPQLTKGYDDNGNAILNLSGNVNTIVESLDDLVSVQQKLANQEILEKMPDIWAGYTVDLDEYNEELDNAEKKTNGALKAMSKISKESFTLEDTGFDGNNLETNQAIRTALEKMELSTLSKKSGGYFESKHYGKNNFDTTWDFSSLTDSQIERLKDELGALSSAYEDEAQLTKSKIETANSEISSYINTWISGEWNFTKMDSGIQNLVKDVLLNSDWINQLPKDVDSNNWDEVSNWLQQHFLYAINDIDNEKIKTALVDAFNGNFTIESLQEVISNLLNTEGFNKDNPLIIYLQTKVNNKKDKIDTVKAKLDDDKFNDKELSKKIGKLSQEDLEYAAEIEVSDNSLLSWDELLEKIKEVKEAKNSTETQPIPFEEAWSSLDNIEDSDSKMKDLKESLLELAEAGQLTIEAFKEAEGSEDFLKQLGLDPERNMVEIEDFLHKINEMESSADQLSSMRKGITSLSENLYNKKEEPGEAITADVFAGMDDALKEQKAEWENYVSVLGNASSSIDDVQKATDRLATAYINSNNFLANLTESNKDYYVSQLASMGVDNAEEIVQQSLTQKIQAHELQMRALAITKDGLTVKTRNEVAALLEEAGASDSVKRAVVEAVAAERIFAVTDLGVGAKITQLKLLMSTYYGAAAAAQFAAAAANKDAGNPYEELSPEQAFQNTLDRIAKTGAEIKTPTINVGGSTSYNKDKGGGGSGSGSSPKPTPETFDFIEIAISRIEAAIDRIKAKAEATFLSLKSRANSYNKAIAKVTEEINLQTQAYNAYMAKANSVGLEAGYAAQVQNGSINIEDISDDGLKERIKNYQEWWITPPCPVMGKQNSI